MWKVLLADDEPKIRRGIHKLIDWNALGMEVVGEAEDGEMALELARELRPDIILADICMPFLNGLQFIEQIRDDLKDAQIIVITGYDEFAYAQQALKLHVFDYLLKPVAKDQLQTLLQTAAQNLAELQSADRYLQWASQETTRNRQLLRNDFFAQWVGESESFDPFEQMRFLDLHWPADCTMAALKLAPRLKNAALAPEWSEELLQFALRNLALELLQDFQPLAFDEEKGGLTLLLSLHQQRDLAQCDALEEWLTDKMTPLLPQKLFVCRCRVDEPAQLPKIHRQLQEELRRKERYTPAVLFSKRYIERHYWREALSLQEVADAIPISPTYLSRQLKQELGASFIDYLIHIRVKKAIQLLQDPELKLYEIAERVGYSNQHYFSTAFKKVTGVSPAEYRKRGPAS